MGTALKGERRALRAPQSSVPRVKWQWDPQHRAGTSSSSQLVTAALEPNSFHLQPLQPGQVFQARNKLHTQLIHLG